MTHGAGINRWWSLHPRRQSWIATVPTPHYSLANCAGSRTGGGGGAFRDNSSFGLNILAMFWGLTHFFVEFLGIYALFCGIFGDLCTFCRIFGDLYTFLSNFWGFTHFFVKFFRDRHLRTFVKILNFLGFTHFFVDFLGIYALFGRILSRQTFTHFC